MKPTQPSAKPIREKLAKRNSELDKDDIHGIPVADYDQSELYDFPDPLRLSEDGYVFPQRQLGKTELAFQGRPDEEQGSNDLDLLNASGACRDEGNNNCRGEDDIIYNEMVEFLPQLCSTFTMMPSAVEVPLCVFPVSMIRGEDSVPSKGNEATSKDKDEARRLGESTSSLMSRITRVTSSLLKLMTSLETPRADDRLTVDEEGKEMGGQLALGLATLDKVVEKVDTWINNHGRLIETAYTRGLKSSESRLKVMSHELTICKQRLFDVSRDRQTIVTYLRRYEKNWACRQERLRMEVVRLQKVIQEFQKSCEESRPVYEGERGLPGGKPEDRLDRMLAVLVEHQNKINELKLTVFAQQQHVLFLEQELREKNGLLHAAKEDNRDKETNDPCASDVDSKPDHVTEESPVHSQGPEKCDDKQTKTEVEEVPLSTSSRDTITVATTTGDCYMSKMSDVLLCDEGDYRFCQTNESGVATDETLTNLRCLCQQHGGSCGTSAQVQLVGQLPYLMDSPLDIEVSGVLARPKPRPFSLADLPYVRKAIQQSIPTEQPTAPPTPSDFEFLFQPSSQSDKTF